MPLGHNTRALLTSVRAATEAAVAAGGTSAAAMQAAQALATLLNVDQQQHAVLKAELSGVASADDVLADVGRILPSSVASTSSAGGAATTLDLARFASFLAEWLAYLAAHPAVGPLIAELTRVTGAGSGHQQRLALVPALPWDVRAAYEGWVQVYSRAHLVFGMSESFWFIPTLRWLSETLVVLGIKSDTYLRDPRQRNATESASRLSKSAGLAGNDRSPAPPSGIGTKRPAVMFLANQSFRAYFKLNNVRLCETVLSSVENAVKINRQQAAQDALLVGGKGKQRAAGASAAEAIAVSGDGLSLDELAQSGYSRADLVTYRYYLGRMRLHQHRLRAAESELSWAFNNCTDAQPRNKRLILIYLLTAAIPLGRLPKPGLLQAFDLDRQFGGIVQAFRLGAARATLDALDSWREWHRRRGTYLILREKLQIGLWRNLIRRSIILNQGYFPPSNAPPNIKLSLITATARLAWQDDGIDDMDVECITASLIDQGYLKGYLHFDKHLLIYMRGEQLGFVPMRTVYK